VQYVAAFVLLNGNLTTADYEDKAAADPRIDALRGKMVVSEDKQFTSDFFDARKRSNANAMRIEFSDGSSTREVLIEYPVGHPRRRREALPLVEEKFQRSVERAFAPRRGRAIFDACGNLAHLKRLPFRDFMDLLAA
jgi:2-methylcitrate dehydratase